MARAGWTLTVKGGEKIDLLERRVKAARRKPVGIEVGLFKSARYPDGTPVAFVGAIHEFGAPNAKIPERPWFRLALPKIQEAVRDIIRAYLRPDQPVMPKRVAEMIGATAQGLLQESITELATPPLAESTKAIKRAQGKREPYNVLIDTGFMRASVTFEVRTG